MRTFTGFMLMAVTFAIMTALGLGLQWLNARYSVLGTAPFAIAVIIMIIYLRRRDKAQRAAALQRAQDRDRRR